MPFTATCSRVILGGMTLAAPGATGFVALAQRAVIEHVRSCFSTVCCPDYRTTTGDQRLPAAAALMVFASGSATGNQRAACSTLTSLAFGRVASKSLFAIISR